MFGVEQIHLFLQHNEKNMNLVFQSSETLPYHIVWSFFISMLFSLFSFLSISIHLTPSHLFFFLN